MRNVFRNVFIVFSVTAAAAVLAILTLAIIMSSRHQRNTSKCSNTIYERTALEHEHKGSGSALAGVPKKMISFSVLVIQMEDRKDAKLARYMAVNKKICEARGMLHVFVERSSFHAPPYWRKVFEVQKALMDNPAVNYVMWLDSDAFFLELSPLKTQLLLNTYQDYGMIVSKDMPPWESGEFNAGVFFVKNNIDGHMLIEKWLSTYHSSAWNFCPQEKTWSTEAGWSGKEYEQGAFAAYVLTDPQFKPKVVQLPYFFMNDINCDNKWSETISVHLAGSHKNNASSLKACDLKHDAILPRTAGPAPVSS